MLEFELSGQGNGWTDKTKDLMGEETVTGGLPGSGIKDRVATTGELRFSLNNHESNSVGRRSAYSPDHANVLTGFKEGIRVRYSQVVNGEKIVLHVGTLDQVQPEPDPKAGSFLVNCLSVDYMDDLARASCSGVQVLQNARDDQLFSELVKVVPRQPDAIQVFPGPDTFAVALDKVEQATRVISELVNVCQSSLSLVYIRGDMLVYEPRNVRASSTSAIDTFTSKMTGLDVSRNRVSQINRVEVTAHPRRVDANPTTVLWSLPSGNPIRIFANTSLTIWAPYTISALVLMVVLVIWDQLWPGWRLWRACWRHIRGTDKDMATVHTTSIGWRRRQAATKIAPVVHQRH